MLNAARTARWPWEALGLALAITLAGVFSRPLIPVDETRYLAVAWEMRVTGDFLVPHLNGAAYSHKPPLLFWLINLVWSVTGVAEWSGRLVAPVFGLICIGLTWRLACRFWPNRSATIAAAPLILATIQMWALFASLTMFDTLLTAAVLAAVFGCLLAAEGQSFQGWTLAGLAIGLGILAKGPVCFVHLLPVVLGGPWWHPQPHTVRWSRWYLGFLAAATLGVGLALCWAIPAALHGGAAYRDAILWGQTAGRVVQSFAHRRPWWWYLVPLPLVLTPWCIWGAVWRAVRRVPWDAGARCCAVWAGGAFLFFSCISGKQLHYLLPELPALALLVAYLVTSEPAAVRRVDQAVVGAATVVWGVVMLALPWCWTLPGFAEGELWTPWCGLPIIASGTWLMLSRPQTVLHAVRLISIVAVLNGACGQMGLKYDAFALYDVRPISVRIAELQRAGIPVIHNGLYEGQFHFGGRLRQSLDESLSADELAAWTTAHPQGYVIMYSTHSMSVTGESALADQPYLRDLKKYWVRVEPAASSIRRVADTATTPH